MDKKKKKNVTMNFFFVTEKISDVSISVEHAAYGQIIIFVYFALYNLIKSCVFYLA